MSDVASTQVSVEACPSCGRPIVEFPDTLPEPITYPVKNGWHATPPTGGRAAWGKTEDAAKIAYIAMEEKWAKLMDRIDEPVVVGKGSA